MGAIEDILQSVFGTVIIFAISIAVILAIVAFVLLEACWVLRLFAELDRRFRTSPRRTAKGPANRIGSRDGH